MSENTVDSKLRVETLYATANPQQCVYAAMHQDYSEEFVVESRAGWPNERVAGQLCVKHLLSANRGHFGPLEHPSITLNVGYFPHSVMQQARTHRIGCCLIGDTVVRFGHPSMSDGQTYYTKTISELASLWHEGRSHQMSDSDACYMKKMIKSRKLLQANEDTGLIQHTKITNIFRNGVRPVYAFAFAQGQEITATKNHKVFTPDGWRTLGELEIGDQVYASAACSTFIEPAIPSMTQAETDKESWRPITGYEWYEVSDFGRVRSWAPRKHRGVLRYPSSPRIKKQSKSSYLFISLAASDGSGSRRFNVHSLVLSTFSGNAPNGFVARHLNGNAYDNRLTNLAWGTQAENASDRVKHGVSCKQRVTPVSLVSVSSKGMMETYDLEVEGPFHNFVANDLIVHNSFDVQSGRYTSKGILRVAKREQDIEEIFYLRPVGRYVDRNGAKYEYTEDQRKIDLARCYDAAAHYAHQIRQGLSEEHARDMIPYSIRQHWVVSFNMRSLMHFLDLRSKKNAQLEIQWACDKIWPHFLNWAPEIAEWYATNRLHKARLAP
jgi:thymidylate synthase (FAD)